MPRALFALALINVAIGTQGFAFVGVLAELAHDLDITMAAAGLVVGASALTYAIAAPVAAGLVANIERRRVIVAGLMALAAINALCSVVPSFPALALLRLAAGVATAFVGALATVAAAALVPPAMRGRAFAIVLGGLTVAFVLGVPLGSAIGGAYGWQATFVMSAGICVVALVLIRMLVPPILPGPGPRGRLADIAANATVLRALGQTLLGFAATFTVVSFIGPVLTATTGAVGAGVGAFQIFVGIGSIAGLAIGGFAADRGQGRAASMLAFAAMAVSLAAYQMMLSAPQGTTGAVTMAALIFVGAAALFCLIPINLSAIAAAAGPAAPIALALNGSLVSLGQGIGALLGGWLTVTFGLHTIGAGGAAIAAAGLLLTVLAGDGGTSAGRADRAAHERPDKA